MTFFYQNTFAFRILRMILLLLFASILAACQVEFYEGLSQSDANEMTAKLREAGLSASRSKGKDGSFTVFVDEDDFVEAVKVIKASGLPRQTFMTLGDLFNEDRLISTPTEERARLIYGLSQELSHTVSSIAGVVSARVHIVLPTRDSLDRQTEPATASVAIHHDQHFDPALLSPRVRQLIANSVEGLDYENVTIALFPLAGAVTPKPQVASHTPPVAAQAQTTAALPAAPVDQAVVSPETTQDTAVVAATGKADPPELLTGFDWMRLVWAIGIGLGVFILWIASVSLYSFWRRAQ